jgi:hypothetical protein
MLDRRQCLTPKKACFHWGNHFFVGSEMGGLNFVNFPTKPHGVSDKSSVSPAAIQVCVGFAARHVSFQVGTVIAV